MGKKEKTSIEAMVYTECLIRLIDDLDIDVEDANVFKELGFKGFKAWRAKILFKRFARIAAKTGRAIEKLRKSVKTDEEKQVGE